MPKPISDNWHTFSLVTRDRPGVLVRISAVFARRGYNIESLAVSQGAVGGFARMTIVSRGEPQTVDQMVKQLAKLIDVVFVTVHDDDNPVEVEAALCKLRCAGEPRTRVLDIAKRYGARVEDDGAERVIVTMYGSSNEVSKLLEALRPYNLEELVRTGKIVIDRGASRFAHLIDAPAPSA